MKNRFPLLKWLFARLQRATFKIPPGGYAIILQNHADFEQISDGLSDAESWTGVKYSDILTKSETQILYN
ncbi:MAG: hypothetical protein Q8R96_11535 [Bacteroidota bacterium]|nr:hypothetical protein [Bacteroidota bacterium]